MPDNVPEQSREQQIQAAVNSLHQLNDQLAVFHAARRVLDTHPRSTSPAIREIRGLYQAYDQKHPNAAKGAEQ